jgi:hypothetical protein
MDSGRNILDQKACQDVLDGFIQALSEFLISIENNCSAQTMRNMADAVVDLLDAWVFLYRSVAPIRRPVSDHCCDFRERLDSQPSMRL